MIIVGNNHYSLTTVQIQRYYMNYEVILYVIYLLKYQIFIFIHQDADE